MAKFSITGEFLTERIRDLWESRDFKKAIKLGLESLEGADLSHIVSIIDGDMKLIGTDVLDLVEDGNFKPNVSFLEILNYAMLPNTGYFRIYEQDSEIADKILNSFDMTYPDSIGDTKRQDYIYQWNQLLPEVRIDNYDRITHWMAVYLRRSSDDADVRRKADFYSANIIETEAPVDLDRKTFNKLCDKYHIYSDREETWEQCLLTRKQLIEPSKQTIEKNIKEEFKKYKSDISMKSEYGWLSPDGRFTVCEWANHEVLASIMCEYFKYEFTEEQKNGRQLSDVLLKIGYVKIHRDDIGMFHITHDRKLTREQELKIDRYKSIHKINP